MARKAAKRPAAKAPAAKAKASGRRFNPLAAFAEIFPAYNGASKYQDGGYFSPNGDLLWEDHPATTRTVVNEETVVSVDPETGEKTSETVTTTTEVPDLEAGDPKVILAAWLKGEVDLPHLKVVNFVKKGFGEVKRTKAEVMEYLVGEVALVPAELVKV